LGQLKQALDPNRLLNSSGYIDSSCNRRLDVYMITHVQEPSKKKGEKNVLDVHLLAAVSPVGILCY